MALRKPIENPQTGATSNYWRLAHVALDIVNARCTLTLAGYTSASIRGKPDGIPIDQRVLHVVGDDYAQMQARHFAGENIGALAYEYIKRARPSAPPGAPLQPPEFADAEDV